ncbi:MAG: lysophospholipid acyltransferase family protein [Planctomycetota bacterium]
MPFLYRTSLALARAAAPLARGLIPRTAATVRENLRLAYGEVDERLVRAVYRHFLEATVDLRFYRSLFDRSRLHEHFQFEGGGLEHFLETKPHGAILVSGHFGNWELLAAALCQAGLPLAPVARSFKSGWFARRMEHFRTATGQSPIAKDKALPAASSAIRKGKCVALLMDQSAGAEGIAAPFFGRPVQTFPAAALLALKHGVPLYAGYSTRLGPGIRYRCWAERVPTEEGDVESVTRRLNELLEGYVRACPEQWWWFHRRFKPPHFNLCGVPWSATGLPLTEFLEPGPCREMLDVLREAGPHFNALVVESDGLDDPQRRAARTDYLRSRLDDARESVAALHAAVARAGHDRAADAADRMDGHLDGVAAALEAGDLEAYQAAADELPLRHLRLGHALLIEEALGRDAGTVEATLKSLERHYGRTGAAAAGRLCRGMRGRMRELLRDLPA